MPNDCACTCAICPSVRLCLPFVSSFPRFLCVLALNCADMDCDGMKHVMVHDHDGSLSGAAGGVLFSRAERFSDGSFFGLQFKDTENHAFMSSRWGRTSAGHLWYASSATACVWLKCQCLLMLCRRAIGIGLP